MFARDTSKRAGSEARGEGREGGYLVETIPKPPVAQRAGGIVDIEIQALLIEKKGDFALTLHVPAFRKMIDHHQRKSPISVSAPSSDQQEKCDVDALALFEQQTKYDVQAFENWKKKCRNCFVSRHHALQEFSLMRRKM